jgi:hypothetical protein
VSRWCLVSLGDLQLMARAPWRTRSGGRARFSIFGVDLQSAVQSEWRQEAVYFSYVVSMLAAAPLLHSSDSHDFALLSQSSAVEPEHDRNRDHHSREAAEQSPSPLDAQVGEHLASEEREASRDD